MVIACSTLMNMYMAFTFQAPWHIWVCWEFAIFLWRYRLDFIVYTGLWEWSSLSLGFVVRYGYVIDEISFQFTSGEPPTRSPTSSPSSPHLCFPVIPLQQCHLNSFVNSQFKSFSVPFCTAFNTPSLPPSMTPTLTLSHCFVDAIYFTYDYTDFNSNCDTNFVNLALYKEFNHCCYSLCEEWYKYDWVSGICFKGFEWNVLVAHSKWYGEYLGWFLLCWSVTPRPINNEWHNNTKQEY